MNTLAPYLLFLLVVLSAVGPARADEARAERAQVHAVASMELPRLARKLRARLAAAELSSTVGGSAGDAAGASATARREAEAPASLAVMMPDRP